MIAETIDALKLIQHMETAWPVRETARVIAVNAGLELAFTQDMLDQLVLDGAVELQRRPVFPWDPTSEAITVYRETIPNIYALMWDDDSGDDE